MSVYKEGFPYLHGFPRLNRQFSDFFKQNSILSEFLRTEISVIMLLKLNYKAVLDCHSQCTLYGDGVACIM